MAYENLAAKYRPRNLAEVMGQETIKTTLANSVKLGRLAHSYVFYGPRGCGKTTIARILAKTLNCPDAKDGKPCDKCASCLEIADSKSLDVAEIDAASHTDVENVRSVIIENVGLAPSRDKYKIYILDEVHMLSKQSFNALLKTIEEPPAHVVFIMATTEQTKVPLTILSRSQCFRFRPIPEELISARLEEVAAKEKIKVSAEALAVIARSAGGAMRDALTLLDRAASFGKGSVELGILNELLGHASPDLIRDVALALVKRDAAALYAGFEKIADEGYDPLTILRDLRDTLAETFLHLHGFSKTTTALAAALDKNCSPALLARLSRKLNAVTEEVKFSDSPALAAEIALFTLVETPQDLDGLVGRLEALESRLSSGSPSMPDRSSAEASPADSQKKNEKSGLTPPAPEIPREPAALPSPAASAIPSSALWKRLLGAVSARKPVLYNILLSVRVAFDRKDAWTLVCVNKFEAGIVDKAKVELEEHLERAAGGRISLTVVCGEGAQQQAAVPDEDAVLDSPESEGTPDIEEEADIPPAAPRISKTGTPVHVTPGGAAAGQTRAGLQQEDERLPEEEPELKHLKKVFHGRITRIQKVVKQKEI